MKTLVTVVILFFLGILLIVNFGEIVGGLGEIGVLIIGVVVFNKLKK